MRKIYFFHQAIAKMTLFIKPQSGKIHVRYWKRDTTFCGEAIEGETVKEAPEGELCTRCLHSMNRDCYSYREEESQEKIQAQELRADLEA